MENPAATGLPEVDSLPDGFVDSTPERLSPPTPTFDQERPLTNYKVDNVLEHVDLNDSPHESSTNESKTSENRVEKVQQPRNFAVPLSTRESSNPSVELVDGTDKGYKEQTFGATTSAAVDFVDLGSESSENLSGCSEVKEQAQGKFQSSERSSGGSSNIPNTKATAWSEEDLLKNKKETSEGKRKNVKRSFKSEQEFLEFTLKYQQVLAERDTAITVRDKLESLCRELQRQNKMLMDECKRVSTEGQNLRLDLSTKFQDAIKEVSVKLEQQKDECLSQLKENEMLKIKLKALADQYVLSEQHHEQELKQKNLELQIAELKIKQHEEKTVQEQSQMKIYAEQVSQLLATEKNLRLQLTADGEKFQQFQDALLKSNEVFETFKQEIEKMAKSIKDLKKENTFLKSKCEKSDVTLIELVEEREHTKKQTEKLKNQIEKLKNQKEKLESLCRTLQAERRQNSLGISSSSSGSSDSTPA